MNAATPDVARLVEIAQELADAQGRPFLVVRVPQSGLSYDRHLPYCVALEDATAWDRAGDAITIEPRSKT